MNIRIGTGYDVHKLEKGQKLVLGGVEIPYDKGLLGWSDADVAVHVIIDALLGATAMGDIGTYFPSDDPQYEGISSLILLEKTGKLIKENQWQIGNIDVTIIAQEPKLAPFINTMREKTAKALSLNEDQIGIKAKTSDKLGFEGKGEGIVAHAVALVRKPNEDS